MNNTTVINGLVFGKNENEQSVMIPDKLITTHSLIFGADDEKKEKCITNIVEQQIKRGGGMIFVDGKGHCHNSQMIYETLKKNNREKEFVYLEEIEGNIKESVSDIINDNHILFINTNLSYNKDYWKILKEVFTNYLTNQIDKVHLKDAIEFRKQNSIPPFLLIIEQYDEIEHLSDFFAQIRALGTGIIMGIKDKNSIEKVSKEESIRILGNSVCKIFLTINDDETKEYVLNMTGKENFITSNDKTFDGVMLIDDKVERFLLNQ